MFQAHLTTWHAPSQVAVAHSILVAAYWMLTATSPTTTSEPTGNQRRNNEAHTRRLMAQLEHLATR
jgi:hypothetical protein